jgi:hypothetical protein
MPEMTQQQEEQLYLELGGRVSKQHSTRFYITSSVLSLLPHLHPVLRLVFLLRSVALDTADK